MNEQRFDGMGKIYAKYRPKYPREFIEYLYCNAGVNQNSVIADIGAGTGILTKQLLEKGNKVFAIEPNADMRAVAEADLSGFKNYNSITGTAENTTLESNSVDFITVAQAFHWFDRAKFKTECNRILKPKGKIILVWNSRVEDAEVVRDGDEINKKYCKNFKGFSGGMRGVINDGDFDDFFVGEYEIKVFDNDQTADFDEFIGRNLSSSYALKENDENYKAYVNELTMSFNKHAVGGRLIMPMVTRIFAGTLGK